MPHPPYSHDLTSSDLSDLIFVSRVKKVLREKHLADVEEVKKNGRSTKGIKIEEFKNSFENGKNNSIGVFHQVESTLKVTEV